MGAVALGEAFELVVEVGLDVLGALGQRRQPKRPEVEPREEVIAEAAGAGVVGEVAVGAADELEVARGLAICAERAEALGLQRAEEHRLLLHAELAHLVEEEHAAVGLAQEALTCADGAGERAALVAEEGGHRAIAANGGAVHVDEGASDLPALALELVDPPRQT